MDTITLYKTNKFKGNIEPPPDKSISHRAIFFSSIANGKSVIHNFLNAADPISTINAFRMLGVDIKQDGNIVTVTGNGLRSLREPNNVIDCGNSGTTIRLISGLLSACTFHSVLTGDDSLRGRPMSRVITPLKMMDAKIDARASGKYPPISITGGKLSPIKYKMPIASAQVKTSIILAALLTEGTTEIEQPIMSRDHTERMLKVYGADLKVDDLKISVTGGKELNATEVFVPGDISSAAFFIAASQIIKGSSIKINNCGLNPTRIGLLEILDKNKMGGEVINYKEKITPELIGSIECKYPKNGLKAVNISEDDIPFLIDEFPIIAVLATQAEGETIITGARELRVKESDRISAMAVELTKMGADIEELPDGMIIRGKTNLKGARVNSHNDHRIAMALSIAALIADGDTIIEGKSAVDISFPEFYPTLERLIK
ncbi:MAG: 3-phosphoshikimate 1-carboxyvinyltransferase [Nitrospirae bacterium]|nr:3-phosphoshikimate 1-carboxyvinyltransferase [Nitrospirota bacterium]MBF0542031.1 3-phosphoshikimate 1-carboxyvinyltransferase [Nitrospirota bacterium]